MVTKIITFTANAVKHKNSWVCRECNKKFKLGTKIATKRSQATTTSHYHINCAKKLNLL